MTTVPGNPDPDAGIEHLLAMALARFETDGEAGLQRLLTEHPERAEDLRRHLSRLRALGLLTPNADDTAAPPSAPPEQLGDFRLLSRLGGGGMGVVYEAEQRSLGRRVALKLIRSEHLYFPGARERFQREVESVARLQHPAIVPVHATGEDSGVPWLAMELIRGASVDEVLQVLADRDPTRLRAADLQQAIGEVMRRRGGAPEVAPPGAFEGSWVTSCVRIARAIAEALEHAHQRGVMHRDVKPSNIMLTPDGRALLLDFGLARAAGAVQLTRTGNLVGTPAYMSPEQMRGGLDGVDARTDVYSLGVTLRELLTLRSPFVAASTEATRQRVMNGTTTPMRSINGAVPPDVEVVCQKAMDVEASRRYPSASAFADDLANVLARRPIVAQPPGAFLIARRWAQRRPALAITLVAAFLIGFVAPTAFYLQQRAANSQISGALATAETERDHARQSLAKAIQDRRRARDAVETMLTRVANESLLDVPRMQHVRRDLLVSARSFQEQFLQDSGDDPELFEDTVDAARMLAVLDGELGRSEQGAQSAQRALELARRLVAVASDATTAAVQLGRALVTMGQSQQTLGRLPESLRALDEGEQVFAGLRTQHPDDLGVALKLMNVQRSRALVLTQLDRDADADAAYQDIARIWDQIVDHLSGSDQWANAMDVAIGAGCDQAQHHLQLGDREAASSALDRCEVLGSQQGSALEDSTVVALSRVRMARARLVADDPGQREQLLHEALRIVAPLLQTNPEYANALRLEANIYNELFLTLSGQESRQEDAIRMIDESIARLRRLVAVDPEIVENRANLASSLANLGAIRQNREELTSALQCFTEAEPMLAAAIAEVPSRREWADNHYKVVWFLGQVYGALAMHEQQAAAATRLAALRPDDARTQRIAAELLATSIAAAQQDAALADERRRPLLQERASAAMSMLGRAAELGCTDFEWLRTSHEFAPLRQNAGFAAILTQVQANQAKAAATGR